MKKIMMLVQASQYGGGTKQTLFILQELLKQGLQASLVTNSDNTWLLRRIEEKQLPIKVFVAPVIRRSLNPWFDLRMGLFLYRTFRSERPDAIVSAGVKLLTMAGVIGWLARVPRIVSIIRGQGSSPGSLRVRLSFLIERLLGRMGSRFITVCNYDRLEMLQRRIAPADAIVTVHNGTDIEIFSGGEERGAAFRARFGVPADAFVVGMVGRFFHQKRYDLFIDYAIDLCAAYPQAYALLIGDGPQRDELQEAIDRSGFADRITITGYCDDMVAAYRSLDLSVLFTRYEGCANALIESAAAGLPMIAEDVCGNAEIVDNGVNGFVIEPLDRAAAIGHTRRLIGDPALRARMAAAAERIARESFDNRRQTARLVEQVGQWCRERTDTLKDAVNLPQDLAVSGRSE